MKLYQHILLKYVLTGIAFAMVLVLTPRAFVDSGRYAGTMEVPVRVLDQDDTCLWCTPPQSSRCDDSDANPHWLNPDQILPHQLPERCVGQDGEMVRERS